MRVLSVVLAAAVALPMAGPLRAEVVNRIVARVNDRIATYYDYESRFQENMLRVQELPADPVEREEFLKQQARDTMKILFEELLILSRADQLGIFVSDVEVDEALLGMREANGLEDNDRFREALAQAGMTVEELRKQYRNQLTFQRVMGREVYSRVELSEEDLRRYYRENEDEFREPERVQIREIVVLEVGGADPAAEALAAELVAALRAGSSLEEVREGRGDDAVSPIIETGWVVAGDLDPALEAAIWDLDVGGFSEPTRARGGLHIAEVLAREEAVLKPFKDVEEEIDHKRRLAETNDMMNEYLVDLEKKSYLFLDPPPEAAGFRTATGETPLSGELSLMESSAAARGDEDGS
ncbi:MAG: SurA N-terminal domain-containing protein [Thermoanaerobaculia bacterium]|nr:SurA N-terminal domain-containing protein [Thermoanaerobaculia bacterium]